MFATCNLPQIRSGIGLYPAWLVSRGIFRGIFFSYWDTQLYGFLKYSGRRRVIERAQDQNEKGREVLSAFSSNRGYARLSYGRRCLLPTIKYLVWSGVGIV
jgi:hypothetical protein